MPLNSEMWQGCSLFLLLFNIMLVVLDGVMRQKKEINGIQIGKKGQTILFEDDMIKYIRYPKNFYQKISRNGKEIQQCGKI